MCGLVGVTVVPGIVLAAVRPDAPVAYLVVVLTCLLVPLGSALFVSRNAPNSVVAPLLAAQSLVMAALAAADIYGAIATKDGLPMAWPVAGLKDGGWMAAIVVFALLLLYFPDGRLPGRHWWVVAAGLVVTLVVFMAGTALSPHGYQSPWQDLSHPSVPVLWRAANVVLPVFLALIAASAVSVVVRYRRGDSVQRRQLRWLAFAGLVVPPTLALSWLAEAFFGSSLPGGLDQQFIALTVLLLAMFVVAPVAIALGIVRHDLFDVDRAVVVASVSGLVGALLLGVFAVVSTAAGLVASHASTGVAVLVTAAVAVSLATVRGRLVTAVGSRLYPDCARVVAAVGELRQNVAAGRAAPEDLEDVLRRAARDPELRVGYCVPGLETPVDRRGQPVPATPTAVVAELGGERVGILVPGDGTRGWLFTDVLEDAAVMVEMGRLRAELRAALAEVEASRSRLVRAGYEERRRLELDLHDGAQQRLVSLGMSLRLAQRHLLDGSVNVDNLIDTAVAELATAVAELRQIAHGLRPSTLDDGLGPALENLTRSSPVPVALEVDAPDLPDDVSTTCYFVASEAVANAVKHADPGAIAMSVRRTGAFVSVRVSDDGCGGAVARPGSGLAGLRDRVGALGGTLGVQTAPGAGTIVEAVLPCEL